MLSAETSALVAGGMRAPATASPVQVRVVRAVMWAGQRAEPGTVLSVDRWQAAELVTAGKAERVPAPAAAAQPKQAAKPQKEKTHVER